MDFKPALLEVWMRQYYFDADIDIGSSGVEDLSLADLRAMLGITQKQLDDIVFRDSTSYGGPELRRAAAARWGNGDADWVMVTHGASEATYLLMNALLEPGDEIVTVEPVYHALVSTAAAIGCTIVPWELSPAESFAPDLSSLAALVNRRTRMVVVNFPHNPTGAHLTPDQQRDLVAIAEEAGAYLVWDTALAELSYIGPTLPDVTTLYRRGVSVGSLSKAYGLPGLRFGWCMADPSILARMVHLRDRMTLHLSPLTEFLARHVAENGDVIVAGKLERARRNRDTVVQWAEKHKDLVDAPAPGGGVTMFPRLKGVDETESLCRRLAVENRTLLVPGNCFGHPSRVRLGFGGPSAQLGVGLDVLSDALRNRTE